MPNPSKPSEYFAEAKKAIAHMRTTLDSIERDIDDPKQSVVNGMLCGFLHEDVAKIVYEVGRGNGAVIATS
jgi:hypothetical protein